MERINFENNVTKASAETFNTLQDNIENAISYSTNETQIGKWINGKPLYRKIVTLASAISVTANTWADTGITISNIDKLVSFNNTTYLNLYSAKYLNGIKVLTYTAAPMASGSDCIIEYTKTTD